MTINYCSETNALTSLLFHVSAIGRLCEKCKCFHTTHWEPPFPSQAMSYYWKFLLLQMFEYVMSARVFHTKDMFLLWQPTPTTPVTLTGHDLDPYTVILPNIIQYFQIIIITIILRYILCSRILIKQSHSMICMVLKFFLTWSQEKVEYHYKALYLRPNLPVKT